MTKKIKIRGMSCQHCVGHVAEALKRVPGVDNVAVDLANGTAMVDGGGQLNDNALKDAVEKAGYKVVNIS